jgi:hypothetical protein
MHERQGFFPLICPYSLFFCFHLDWHRAYICVRVSNDAMQNAIERHAYVERERENDGAVRCSSCGTNLIPLRFFSRFLFSLLMRFLPLSLSDISSSSRTRSTLTYREKKYLHTGSKARSCVDLHIQKNDVKLSGAYEEIRHVKP